MTVEIRMLGPFEVTVGGRAAPVGGIRPRTLLALLAINANEAVSTDRLVHEVWGDEPPRTAVDTLYSYVSRLRNALDPAAGGPDGVLATRPRGYELRIPPEAIDALRFGRLVEGARYVLDQGDAIGAGEALASAEALWRGPPLHELGDGTTVEAERHRLNELRLRGLEGAIEARLLLGRAEEAVTELDPLVREHPFRERLHALRMLALYRAGRQADALSAYRGARERLRDGLGIEPCAALERLHSAILHQDPLLTHPRALWSDAPVAPPLGDAATSRPAATHPQGNLPTPLARFVGRAAERRALRDLLARHRLVTLVGIGGVGKTSLAVAVAGSYDHPDGTWFLGMEDHEDPAAVLPALADLLGIPHQSGRSLASTVTGHLRDRRLLLVVDGCEQLTAACAAVIEPILHSCPGVRVLATSREPLGIHGECISQVAPLRTPPRDVGLEEAHATDSVRVFVDRARLVRPDFALTEQTLPAVVGICRLLAGHPLALELAAGRLRMLSVAEVGQRLDGSIDLLHRSERITPRRHHALRSTLDWSYAALDDAGRDLLARLAVFRDGFPLDAVEEVCAFEATAPTSTPLDALASLEDQSLVSPRPVPAGPTRLQLLEPIRVYAADLLDEAQAAALGRRHAEFFTRLAEQARPLVVGPDQVVWFNRLHQEQGNLRAALRWSLERQDGSTALRLVTSVWWFWYQFGHLSEGLRWLEQVLEATGATGSSPLRQEALYGAGVLAWAQRDHARASSHLAESVAVARQVDREGALASSLGALGRSVAAADDVAAGMRLIEEAQAVTRATGDRWCQATVLEAAGDVHVQANRMEQATLLFTQAEQAFREVGDEWSACLARLGAAKAARQLGCTSEAAALHERNLVTNLRLTLSTFDFVGLSPDMQGLAALAQVVGRADLSAALRGAVQRLPRPDTPTPVWDLPPAESPSADEPRPGTPAEAVSFALEVAASLGRA